MNQIKINEITKEQNNEWQRLGCGKIVNENAIINLIKKDFLKKTSKKYIKKITWFNIINPNELKQIIKESLLDDSCSRGKLTGLNKLEILEMKNTS